MPEVEFKIDTEHGTCETEIKRVSSAACEKTARQLKEVLGDPTAETRSQSISSPACKLTSKRK
ncbi:MAG: hypothetical protein IPK01_16785 [Acidobacteria bacterium]|nr:hypothetical protein [Acidobacteriota bacterium]